MKCVVPACPNIETTPAAPFFQVPSTGHLVFKKWSVFMQLSGSRSEKICEQHFKADDFIIRSRVVLLPKAVPSINVPLRGSKTNPNGVCCINRCKTKRLKSLQPFPTQRSTLRRWKQLLAIEDDVSVTKFRICSRHFVKNDFRKVTTKYLKPNAIPSKKVKKLLKFPNRSQFSSTPPPHIWEHNYATFPKTKAKSNRICYVNGCFSRAQDGISLHKFPSKQDKRFKLWLKTLNCRIMPTKNSRVCSKHFRQTDYTPGGRYLKKTAIPIQIISETNGFSSDKSTTSLDSSDPEHHLSSEITQSPSKISSNVEGINSPGSESKISPEDDSLFPAVTSSPSRNNSCIKGQIEANPRNDQDNVSPELPENLNPDNDTFKPVLQGQQCSPETLLERSAVNEEVCDNTYSEAERSILRDNKTILSDLLITDKEVNVWTGIPLMEQLTELCLAVRNVEIVLVSKKFNMHATDRVILTLARLKQNLSFEALGILFRISGVTVSKYFSHTIQILARILKQFIYWPSKEELQQNVPLCFREHFANVTVVLDATEIPVASLKCLNCRISCYSNYKSRRTVKFLIGVSPAGVITFVSQAYSGKSSDKFVFNQERLIDRLESHIDEVMVDKGVSIENECSTKCIKLHMPPFMKGNQLSPNEASKNEAIARARVHVERVIQRVKIFGIFNSTISTAMLGHIDDIMSVVCGIVNLTPPILSDDKF